MSSDLTRRSFLEQAIGGATMLAFATVGGIRAASAQSAKNEIDLFKQINRAKDPNNLQGVEKGHVPQIHAPDAVQAGKAFEVEVRVGQNLHEMLPSHYIDWVDLYADDIFLTKIILTPNVTQPAFKVSVTLAASATLRAVEHCNLHGLWEGTKPVRVE